ncbi:unnamed protein product [Miscanthus lutarioriparius]|uniref:Uncharacterized protein n=1 Tax=Miscanthus lutarioriparius TaxID=422564 RepID=A0A811RV37_9POAL|nr:unnamed protein product [Miscanthus lutarioriparius]
MRFTSGLCNGFTTRITLKKTLSAATVMNLAMEISLRGHWFGTVCSNLPDGRGLAPTSSTKDGIHSCHLTSNAVAGEMLLHCAYPACCCIQRRVLLCAGRVWKDAMQFSREQFIPFDKYMKENENSILEPVPMDSLISPVDEDFNYFIAESAKNLSDLGI